MKFIYMQMENGGGGKVWSNEFGVGSFKIPDSRFKTAERTEGRMKGGSNVPSQGLV